MLWIGVTGIGGPPRGSGTMIAPADGTAADAYSRGARTMLLSTQSLPELPILYGVH
jgi:hypothetical protein